ncbi:PIN domain-containing protein [Streptomyces sp. BPPL-273]|uniref:PIN domain-containing protein n=1 Tax=Streptomyces sp. BPPL-273 TaxID=2987533 RepID=UPI0024AF6E4D|nr:PIN domain-containing protein [Streptomyces sp. BPPL-273]WHM32200.1 PIN domain-containing protein [Streptomyces sp. BPPL-273]
MAIFLDTNVLPRQRVVRNVIISTVLRIAEVCNIKVYLPSVVFDESVNARRQAATTAVDALSSAISGLSKYCDLEPIYIPGIDEIAEDWEKQLADCFEIVNLHGEDAVEALRREATRSKPAKDDGTGARDAAIWLTAKRAHLANGEVTHFVSDNWKDFAAADKASLHGDLVNELGEAANRFHYYRKLDDLLSALASRRDVALRSDRFGQRVLYDLLAQTLSFEELADAEEEGFDDGERLGIRLEIVAIECPYGYEVEESLVCYAKVSCNLIFETQIGDVVRASHIRVRVGCWVVCNKSDMKVAEASIDRIYEKC